MAGDTEAGRGRPYGAFTPFRRSQGANMERRCNVYSPFGFMRLLPDRHVGTRAPADLKRSARTETTMPTPAARRLIAVAASAALAACVAMPTFAQEAELPGEDASVTLTAAQVRAIAATSGNPSARREPPTVDKVADGLAYATGDEGALFGVYYANDPSVDQQGKIYGALPNSLLGNDLLLATTISSGELAGQQWSDYLIRMERRGDEIAILVPDLENRGSGTVAESVRRTYQPRVLVTLPIVATGTGGETVVDLAPLTLGSAISVPGGFANRSLSRHTLVKVFPDNVLIEAERVSEGDVPQLVSFSFRRLPGGSDGYRPRVADERIGYFQTESQDWGKPHDARETVDRYINRWNLQKLDESLEMSPPREPIVFYIEKTVPVRWRRYVQEGIAEWNKAFEEVGIVGAIEVRQQTDTAYADIDPEDARYNFFRWIVSGRAFARGPSRVDPRTGQILDADIVFDDAMLRYFQGDLDLLGPKSLSTTFGADRLAFWNEHPEFRPMGVSAGDVESALTDELREATLYGSGGSNLGVAGFEGDGQLVRRRVAEAMGFDAEVLERRAVASRSAGDHGMCDFADGIRREMHTAALLSMAPATMPTTRPSADDDEEPASDLEAAVDEAADEIGEAAEAVGDVVEEAADATFENRDLPDAFLGLIIKEVVAHEVGHTIGLRHNFKASSWLSLDEIKERRGDATQPTVASVMDYNPILLFAGDDPENVETFITPVIGPYDHWAIEYGYSILPRRTEDQKLDEIASKSGQKEYAFATDDDVLGTISPDPDVNRYDMGDDPVAWAKSRVELADELVEGIEDWALEEGERNGFLREAWLNLFFERIGATRYVVRQVGGQYLSRTHFGDEVEDSPEKPGLTPLSAQEQREALTFLAETVFSDDFFKLDPALLNKLAVDRYDNETRGGRVDLPVHDLVLRSQNYALSHLTDPTVLQRIYDAELKSAAGDDKFTAGEVITETTDAIWKGLDTDAAVPSLRRNLQGQHIAYLLALADSEPGVLVNADLRNQVRYQLRVLADGLGEPKATDLATLAHYSESREQILKVLDAPHIDIPAGGGGGIVLMLGQEAK